jgi:hypothetical protein
MISIGTKLRSDAAELRANAALLIKADDLSTNIPKQIAATVGLTSANVLDGIADLSDAMRVTAPLSPLAAKREEFMTKNDAIRRAAALAQASGNWSDFDRLTELWGARTPTTPDSVSG